MTVFNRRISFNTVRTYWKQNALPIGVYIHNPFCWSVCRFCAYKGTRARKSDTARYYEQYLPAQIILYKKILADTKISSWFFGGGTPSIMTPDMLRNILSLLPGIEAQGEKTFELHPAICNIELLDVLYKYGFHNIILGVQSFNLDVLAKTGRIPTAFSQIKELLQEIHQREMHVWLDIVCFINDDPREISIAEQDIYTALALVPDEISVYINYFLREKYFKEAVKLLTPILHSVCKDWLIDRADLKKVTSELVEQKLLTQKNIRLFNKKRPCEARFIKALENKKGTKPEVSVLGIGSYPRQKTISSILKSDGGCFYFEEMADFHPQFFKFSTDVIQNTSVKLVHNIENER
jgi:coproporphyrinogen III oxidase-like Fe-S oxidoreductase